MTVPACDRLADEVAVLVRELPDVVLDRVLATLEGGVSTCAAARGGVIQGSSAARLEVVLKAAERANMSAEPRALAAMMRGARAAGRPRDGAEVLELVWTGPNPPSSALYRTEQTLLEIIRGARRTLLIVTFAAYKVEGVRDALRDAAARGVRVRLVVEQSEAEGGKVNVDPLDALGGAGGALEVFAWPRERRPVAEDGRVGSLHAKCATADDAVLLVSSANMTGNALELNMELGVLVRGGEAPRRVREHFEELGRRGVLERRGDAARWGSSSDERAGLCRPR